VGLEKVVGLVSNILLFDFQLAEITGLVDNLTEKELSKFAVTIAMNDFVDIGLLLRGESTLTSFLNILDNWSLISPF
jgi:hypothetical protein